MSSTQLQDMTADASTSSNEYQSFDDVFDNIGATVLTYLAVPIFTPFVAASLRGAFKENKPYVLTQEKTKREMFNRAVKDLGNKVDLTKPLSFIEVSRVSSYGLGDLLTEEVTLPKVCTVAGGVLGAYSIIPDAEVLRQAAFAYLAWPAMYATAGIGGIAGAIVGTMAELALERDSNKS
ncbi:MAG TPA: hypothetical protein VHA12_01515 [Candidatus Nanoarchaeia archaeon]|nr:hypothetical protein [Candidatus Nanoarchaeia archaeon]